MFERCNGQEAFYGSNRRCECKPRSTPFSAREINMEASTIIHFTLDGEPLTTTQPVLTAAQILTLGGLDPQLVYLVSVSPDGSTEKHRPNSNVTVTEGAVFVSMQLGPTPVS